ncbi:MAG: TetR/AcrR family transcriptional regulator [Microbacteriaceae bacterium]|jgi:AcrR family transcriptional regulator|nr:TetR/AcrR family transcriptional regulator [Microbacteriaceae bacterium]
MPKVTQEHRDARRREIITAAIRLFARQGFQATSMADIIAESGLSAGAIYGYYKSKDELVQSAMTELLDLRFAARSGDDAALPPGETMRRFITGLDDEMGDLGLLVQVWGQAVLDQTSRDATARIGDRLRAIWASYLTEWYRDGLGLSNAEQLGERFAPLYVGIMQGYILQMTVFGNFDGEAYLEAASVIRPGP